MRHMMIKRLELIEKIRAKIEERESRATRQYAEAVIAADQAERDYAFETKEDWARFARAIQYRLRRDQAITLDMVPEGLLSKGGWGGVGPYLTVFNRTKVDENRYIPQIEGFRSLLLVLESSPDELVSTSALERMGAPVKELFR